MSAVKVGKVAGKSKPKKVSRTGKTQRRMDLLASDVALADYLKTHFSYVSFAEVVRFSLQQQSIRDRVIGTLTAPGNADPRDVSLLIGGIPDASVRRDLLKFCKSQFSDSGVFAVGTGEVSSRLVNFTPEAETCLKRVMQAWGLTQTVDAFRLSIRTMAFLAGKVK